MDVVAALVADHEALHLVQPRERPLDDPAVAPEALARVDLRPRDAALDPAPLERPLVATRAVPLVGVELLRTLARATDLAADGRDGVDEALEERDFVDVGRGEERGERDPVGVRNKMALRARFAAIRRIRPGRCAPLFAGTMDASIAARVQSIRSASRSRASNSSWRRCQTPASFQSRSRRQHVIPEPQPNSCGRSSHGSPVRSTKRMPAKHFRSGMRGRPPWGFGALSGSNGSMISHSSSDTMGGAMPLHRARIRFC